MNPLEQCRATLKRAENAALPLFNAISLATVDKNGKPSLRIMLLKDIDERGFVFYTNLVSRKGYELKACPHAAICFWWPQLNEQIRAEGKVEQVSDKEADAYFATRPRGSQIGAWASKQSQKIESREKLVAEFKDYEKKFGSKNIPRPPHWSGFRLIPESIEFWFGRDDRLHERILYSHKKGQWESSILNP